MRCLKSKVKCVHKGRSPCQRCVRAGFAGCQLTKPIRKPIVRATRPQLESNGMQSFQSQSLAGSPRLSADASANQSRLVLGHVGTADIDEHVSQISMSRKLAILKTFANQYPELTIIHVQTLMGGFAFSPCPPQHRILFAAVLTLTRARLAPTEVPWADTLRPREEYAEYTRARLSEVLLEAPKIEFVQALLIITLHEWGTRDFHKAWMYCGMAIRMMQALYSMRTAPFPPDPTSNDQDHDRYSRAIETKTYWACFIIDCMVNAGTYNPPMLPMSEMRKLRIGCPVNALEYALGQKHPKVSAASNVELSLGIARGCEILVRGFDIWSQLMTFVFNDGRKAPGMCAPRNCPWVSSSPWAKASSRLEAWRAMREADTHYPTASVVMYVTLGYGEAFVYINVLYYVSVIMLRREYLPFLPTPESLPSGPTDPPLLEAEAPENWWEDNARQLFQSAEYIARLLEEASECGVHLMTPFAGFCAFSAGYLCAYVHWFPNMNLGRSPDAGKCLTVCLKYLKEFKKVWSIAEGWINTIEHASLLYRRAATTGRYRGMSRANFNGLHQSLHEFRVVDRSEQHMKEMDGVEQATDTSRDPMDDVATITDDSPDTNVLLESFLHEVNSNMDEQGPWSQWWPPMDEATFALDEAH
ncbi:unnamed protein product [Clonostachys byssicola]|uniref:Xylanolytic transcriptional activator regulatory domain-containing protein n=1 Tax=Clonostachys byssicola TaxID=160290 RepID=A0A9N9XZL7_9HYPO|nr:unnamed protein product [Clonostachys byssicola]